MFWDPIRKRLEEELLAGKLRGIIRYYCPVCGERPEDMSLVRFNGRELLLGEYFRFDRVAVTDLWRAISKTGGLTQPEAWERGISAALENGVLDAHIVYYTAHKVINSSIETSLYGENALARMYAVLDRRVGKRRLAKLTGRMNEEPEWLRQFYLIRLEAEGISI